MLVILVISQPNTLWSQQCPRCGVEPALNCRSVGSFPISKRQLLPCPLFRRYVDVFCRDARFTGYRLTNHHNQTWQSAKFISPKKSIRQLWLATPPKPNCHPSFSRLHRPGFAHEHYGQEQKAWSSDSVNIVFSEHSQWHYNGLANELFSSIRVIIKLFWDNLLLS